MRVNQLKRSISGYISSIEDQKIKDFSEKTVSALLEEQKEINVSNSVIHEIYDTLNQINLLGQIFSRYLSQFASDSISEDIFYQLIALAKFGQILMVKLSHEPVDCSNVFKNPIKLDEKKFDDLVNHIRGVKKNINKDINNLEGILKNLLKDSKESFNKINEITTWDELLNFTYGIDTSDETNGVNKIENINIKELILSNEMEGKLVEIIFVKYDAILTYAMSLLTMMSNTPYSEEFSKRLNSVLESIGSSTQMVLLQQRFLKSLKIMKKIEQEIIKTRDSLLEMIKEKNIDVNPMRAKRMFNYFSIEVRYEEIPQKIPDLQSIPGFKSIMAIANFFSFKTVIYEQWELKQENIDEITITLIKLKDFFDSIIKSANTITADLFAKGFQAALPQTDVEIGEKGGIHLKNIVATSSTQKSTISDEFFDKKQQILRQYDEKWNDLDSILMKRSGEEKFIQNMRENDKLFLDLKEVFKKIFHISQSRNFINGYGEEVAFSSRILYTTIKIFDEIQDFLAPVSKKALIGDNLLEFASIYENLKVIINKIKKFLNAIIIQNAISKKLWHLNRDYVIKIGENQDILENPEKFEELVGEIPKILMREFKQRLIPKEMKNIKTRIFKEMMEEFEKWKNLPLDQRKMLIPYQEIP
jgi:hypothetical protein